MRRRNRFSGKVPAELLDFRLWCDGRGLAGFEAGAFDAWCADRAAWAQVHGWPTGEDARQSEEIAAAASVPEEPWDESRI